MKSTPIIANITASLSAEMQQELHQILAYWVNFTVDETHGGFYGRITEDNVTDLKADKGGVLNARILWSFAAAYRLQPERSYQMMADRAFTYIKDHLVDAQYGGVYWSVDYQGIPVETKKQVYALAFTIYGLSEYDLAFGKQEAKTMAIKLYNDLIDHSYDQLNGGYFEAFTQEWAEVSDLRLSDKDANEKKTMNTHLHVLEAFTTLYKIWQDDGLKERIAELLYLFDTYFIDSVTGHMTLFFDENWNKKSDTISYGHDIEASWLLLEAAEAIDDVYWIQKMKETAVKMATAALEGLAGDGALGYEYEPGTAHFNIEKHWWVQAEAVVGFINAWQQNDNPLFLVTAATCWDFIKDQLLDAQYGEWYWGRNESGAIMQNQDKAGLWKCPYHNSRACMEVVRRLNAVQ